MSAGRFYASELRLVMLRRRNLLLLAVTAIFPLIIGIALRLAAPHPEGGNGNGVAFFNQLSGINAILYFAPRIFELTGLAKSAALLQSVGIGITNLIFTFVEL